MTRKELIEILGRLKVGLMTVATGGDYPEDEYVEARSIIISSPQLSDDVPLFIKSNLTPIEFRRWMQGMYDHYVDRRNYITQEINKLIFLLESKPDTIEFEKTGWDKIDDSVEELLKDLNGITDRVSINEIGVRCRETIILLSNEVYKEELHHPHDFPGPISPNDVKRKFNGYFDYHFPGKNNKEKRDYAKACNDLASDLTHGSRVTKTDAKICISATLSLIRLIKIIEEK